MTPPVPVERIEPTRQRPDNGLVWSQERAGATHGPRDPQGRPGTSPALLGGSDDDDTGGGDDVPGGHPPDAHLGTHCDIAFTVRLGSISKVRVACYHHGERSPCLSQRESLPAERDHGPVDSGETLSPAGRRGRRRTCPTAAVRSRRSRCGRSGGGTDTDAPGQSQDEPRGGEGEEAPTAGVTTTRRHRRRRRPPWSGRSRRVRVNHFTSLFPSSFPSPGVGNPTESVDGRPVVGAARPTPSAALAAAASSHHPALRQRCRAIQVSAVSGVGQAAPLLREIQPSHSVTT